MTFWPSPKPHRMDVRDRLLALPPLPVNEQRTVRWPVRWQLGAIKTLAQWQAKWGLA